jgi:aromatic-L-amino-acid/L-tryptophan decarboxylase
VTRRDGRAAPEPTPPDPARLVADEVRDFRRVVRDLRVAPTVTGAEIRRRLESYTFVNETPVSETLRDVADMLRAWTLHAAHPRYFGLFVPGVHEAGIWSDALAALYNPQLGAWWHAPAASEIEAHTLRFLAGVLGFDAGAAHFTTGGSEANLTALLAAIAAAYPDAPQEGVAEAAGNGVVYVSSQAHHSVRKAVRIAGLGDRVLRVVPCDSRHRLDPVALGQVVEDDAAAGRRAIMILGTVGTTTAGAMDDLDAIGRVAKASSSWFHVDAAWGGMAGFSPRLRPFLRGIGGADSVSCDAHKCLSVPMGAGMFFCRRADVLHALFEVDATYVPKETAEGDDLYLTSLQWSRRFIGLKVFVTLAVMGRQGVAARVQRQLDVADHLRGRLTDAGWIIENDSPLPLICFGHPALASRESVEDVARRVALNGRAWISAATLPGGPVLRACITHDDTSSADADVLCQELERARGQVARDARRRSPLKPERQGDRE